MLAIFVSCHAGLLHASKTIIAELSESVKLYLSEENLASELGSV